MINSVDAEKAFNGIQHPFMTIFSKLGLKEMYLNIIKANMTGPQLTYSRVTS